MEGNKNITHCHHILTINLSVHRHKRAFVYLCICEIHRKWRDSRGAGKMIMEELILQRQNKIYN